MLIRLQRDGIAHQNYSSGMNEKVVRLFRDRPSVSLFEENVIIIQF